MKAIIKVEKEVEISKVLIEIQPRYIGDSESDDMPTDFPLLNDKKTKWIASVNIDTGAIEGWPQGERRSIHVKVCDQGFYSLIDSDGDCIVRIDGYVPHGVVPGSYGDYVELKIDKEGIITNWPKHPDISAFFDDED